MELADRLAAVLPEVVALRHDLHAHPELSGGEERTAGVVAAALDRHGIAHRTRFGGGYGIVATIDGGRPGKTIALRGDMDALPIHELSDVPYKSTVDGVMHACGHDGHTANLLGTGIILNALREELSGRVQLIFQPAEETVNGAPGMIAAGCLDGVDAIVMLHGWPDLPVGTIGVRTGAAMASSDSFTIEIRGKAGHAAYPHNGVDAVYVGSQVVTALQSVVAREVNPVAPAVLSVCTFHAGTARNIVPDLATLSGTIRTLDAGLRASIPERIERVIAGVCAAHRAEYAFHLDPGTPPVVNDAAVTALIRQVGREALGEENVVELAEPTMGAEDFAFYLERVPGAMFRLGTGCPSLLHTPKYDFGDRPLTPGIAMMVGIARAFLSA